MCTPALFAQAIPKPMDLATGFAALTNVSSQCGFQMEPAAHFAVTREPGSPDKVPAGRAMQPSRTSFAGG